MFAVTLATPIVVIAKSPSFFGIFVGQVCARPKSVVTQTLRLPQDFSDFDLDQHRERRDIRLCVTKRARLYQNAVGWSFTTEPTCHVPPHCQSPVLQWHRQ